MEHSDSRELFSALANHSRLSIVQLLRGQMSTVSQIAENLGFEQSRVSHSLARLQRAGIVGCRWEQKRKMFYLADEIMPLLRDVEAYVQRRSKVAIGMERGSRGWNAAAWATARE